MDASSPRWGQPADEQACLSLAVLTQGQHAGFGLVSRETGHWRSRIREACRAGYVRVGASGRSGPLHADRVEALRVVVSEDDAANPFALEGPGSIAIVGMLVAVIEGGSVGSAGDGPLACRIDNACVRPEFRRRGHTARMVGFLAAWATTLDVHRIDLQVARANEPGIATWLALGFAPSGRSADRGFVAMSRSTRPG